MIEGRMRTSKVVSITLPPAMLKEAERLAKRENRTMSELIREALRHYQRSRQLDELNAYGRARAAEMGLTEADVAPLVKAWRRGRRTAR
jgi:CopG family transcriptional regulator/antitoxin EndoAI